jgi:hypothetical protein
MHPPRLRMFAGPNGSGKSTIKGVVPESLLGVYLNPDEIQQEIEQSGFLAMQNYDVATTPDEILAFFAQSTLLKRADLTEAAASLHFSDGKLSFHAVKVNAYLPRWRQIFCGRSCWRNASRFPLKR